MIPNNNPILTQLSPPDNTFLSLPKNLENIELYNDSISSQSTRPMYQ